jgi:iron complex outermembrane recepter protein
MAAKTLISTFLAVTLLLGAVRIEAQTATLPAMSSDEAKSLKQMSIDQLMDIEVTSVSGRAEKLSETASAIQVITQEDIHRSGATSIPEALRLASNLQVAQSDSRNWAISARGFNNGTANKMLVLIDGRTVYTPLYAGVFWDVQDVLLEDVDHIEVISGPGATLWGANAVNGVINVITKQAKDTRGLLVENGGGSFLNAFTNIRYGNAINANTQYRVYGKFFNRGNTFLASGRSAANEWYTGQAGFRMDWRKQADAITVQGDYYTGNRDVASMPDTSVNGNNIIARWTHTLSDKSDLRLQFYWDRTHRNVPNSFNENLDTYDLDFQHRLPIGNRNDFIWGLNYRQWNDRQRTSSGFAFLPAHISRRTFSGFLQDEIEVVKDRLSIMVGTKLEHNDYTGFEIQPSGRVSWKIARNHMAWGAVSRALRTPSRIDSDLFLPAKPPFLIQGGPNFVSEEQIAYELGYRANPFQRLSFSVSAYYNDYDKLRSIEQVNPPRTLPVVIGNGQYGRAYGVELSADYRLTNWWRVRTGYNEMRIRILPHATSTDRSMGSGESHDSNRQLLVRSMIDLPNRVTFDSTLRAVGRIANQQLPAYAEMDLRMGWRPKSNLEFSVVGQNLLHARHAEFGPPTTRQEIQRSVYGKISWLLVNH